MNFDNCTFFSLFLKYYYDDDDDDGERRNDLKKLFKSNFNEIKEWRPPPSLLFLFVC